MLPRIGFSLQTQYNQPMAEIIPILKENGFFAVSPLWTPELDLSNLAFAVREHNMVIQSLHATHKGIALLWEPEKIEASTVFQNIIKSIDDCNRFSIPILVVHGWQGLSYTFFKESLNFCFFDKIVKYAEKQGVSVAFENLEGEEYLEALMNRYSKQQNVGYCWDSGHDNCYPHKLDFLKEFGDRLIMTHLNDNFGLRDAGGIPSGNDDLHLIPYDGKVDWDKALLRLRNVPKQDILNFEIKKVSHSKAPEDLIYEKLTLRDFIEKAGKSARIIAEKYMKIFL